MANRREQRFGASGRWLLLALIVLGSWATSPGSADELRDRIQRDLSDGKDVVITSYVGLWYQNQQDPAHNLFWGNLYGHSALFEREREIRRELPFLSVTGYETTLQRTFADDPIAVKVFGAPVPRDPPSGGRRGRLIIISLAYSHMEQAVHDLVLHLKRGEIPAVLAKEPALAPLLAKSYVMGYWGHNVYYGGVSIDDLETIETAPGDGPRGVFVVGCQTARWFPQKFLGGGIRPLLFTTTNMAPEAYIALALYDGLARGLDPPAIRRNVARAYQHYQKLGRMPLTLFVNESAAIERYQEALPPR